MPPQQSWHAEQEHLAGRRGSPILGVTVTPWIELDRLQSKAIKVIGGRVGAALLRPETPGEIRPISLLTRSAQPILDANGVMTSRDGGIAAQRQTEASSGAAIQHRSLIRQHFCAGEQNLHPRTPILHDSGKMEKASRRTPSNPLI